jgi:DNA repair protein RecO (recombination protein O)
MIIDLLTQSDGRVSIVTHIPKTQRGKLKKQYFQPMNILDVEIDLRPRTQLQHLRDARLAVPFSSIPFHPHKLSIALFLAEFIYYSTRDEQRNEALFAYLEHSILWLDGCTEGFANFHLVFMMRMSRFIGFFPYIEDYQEGDYFDMRAASFTAHAPLHPDFLNRDDSSRINTLMRMNYESMHLFKMSHDDRNRIIDVIITYYRLHVPNFPELKSLQVMKAIFEEGGMDSRSEE